MINYEEKLKELRFNFRPEETIDYQTLITLVASLFTDPEQYEKNKEELFHTLQILVLVYGLEVAPAVTLVKKHHPSRRMMLQLLINHFGDIILPLGGEDAGTDVQTNPRPVLP